MNKLVLLGLCLCCVRVAQADNTPVDAAIVAARENFNQGKFAEARTKLEAALSLAKTSGEKVQLLLRLGLTYKEEKRFDLARQQWNQVLALPGLDTEDLLLLRLQIGASYSDEGNFVQSLKELRPLLQMPGLKDQDKLPIYLAVAASAAGAKDYDEARRVLNQITQSRSAEDGAKALAWVQLGNIALQNKDYAEVRKAFGFLVDFKPAGLDIQAAAQATLAQSYVDEGNREAANREGTKARLLWMQAGQEHAKAKQWNQARGALQEALKVGPPDVIMTSAIHTFLASVWMNQGQPARARGEYEIVINTQLAPDTDAKAQAGLAVVQQSAQLWVGKTFVAEKKYVEARQAFEKLLGMDDLNEMFKKLASDELVKLDALEKAAP